MCTHDKEWVLHRLKTETQIYKGTEASRWEREKTCGLGRVPTERAGSGDHNKLQHLALDCTGVAETVCWAEERLSWEEHMCVVCGR